MKHLLALLFVTALILSPPLALRLRAQERKAPGLTVKPDLNYFKFVTSSHRGVYVHPRYLGR